MGCGHNRLSGFINVDAVAVCNPDEVWDLERTPWPWPDGCAEEVRFIHALEHMGGDPKVFLAIMTELYRIMAPGGRVEIHVPHPRHDNFLNDPTHVRAITPDLLSLFDRELNDRWQATGSSNSPLAHYTGVNFKLVSRAATPAEPYASQLRNGEITQAQITAFEQQRNNVASEFRIVLQAVKDQDAGVPRNHA